MGCDVTTRLAAPASYPGALERLRASVHLRDWPHGGYVCDFQSEETWAERNDPASTATPLAREP